jgi:hypothetical protein
MLELHVDANEFIHKEVAWRHEFGGTTVIHAEEELFRPLMIFGQDESAFHQFMLKSKDWVWPNGERVLLAKSDGVAVMVSAFVSRDTSFGLETDASMLE